MRLADALGLLLASAAHVEGLVTSLAAVRPPPVSIVVVTSAARSHPSTEIIWRTLTSLDFLDLDGASPITIVCDGCRSASSLDAQHAARLAPRHRRPLRRLGRLYP